MSPAENTPNFDSMSPEEIMAWMESLAKRQGATEGFTTSADLEIPDIDPNSVVIDEPGYVPSEGKSRGKTGTGPLVAPRVPDKPVVPAPPVPQPVAAVPDKPAEPIVPPVVQPEPEAAASLSWLESLAADQGTGFPELDLSSLASELTPLAEAPAAPAASPIDWLQNLVQESAATSAPVEAVSAAVPGDMSDPLLWLESLAKRQGAKAEELITPANLDVPVPDAIKDTGPGYTDYSFDSLPGETRPEAPASVVPAVPTAPGATQDPAAWLDSLASAQKVDTSTSRTVEPEEEVEQFSDSEIAQALARGEVVPHDQMEAWMSRQLEIGAQRQEPPELAAYDPDAPAVRAEIPDWLIEQVGQPVMEEPPTRPVVEPPALIEAILEPPPVQDMPDWLKVDLPTDSELDSIFAPVAEDKSAEAVPAGETPVVSYSPGPSIEIDENDPWVEALDLEYRQKRGEASTDELPVWFEKKVATEEQPAIPAEMAAPTLELQDAALAPETQLPAGTPEPVPDWLRSVLTEQELSGEVEAVPEWGEAEAEAEPAAVAVPDIQSWIETDIEPAEIPAWLTEAIAAAPPRTDTVSAAPAAAVPVTPAASTAVVPARILTPMPVQAAIDVPATLSAARAHASSNDIDASLHSYEQLIRANAELDAVTQDLVALSDKIKTSSALYRVLGDGLMRQGKLQSALDTYRKALNQL